MCNEWNSSFECLLHFDLSTIKCEVKIQRWSGVSVTFIKPVVKLLPSWLHWSQGLRGNFTKNWFFLKTEFHVEDELLENHVIITGKRLLFMPANLLIVYVILEKNLFLLKNHLVLKTVLLPFFMICCFSTKISQYRRRNTYNIHYWHFKLGCSSKEQIDSEISK